MKTEKLDKFIPSPNSRCRLDGNAKNNTKVVPMKKSKSKNNKRVNLKFKELNRLRKSLLIISQINRLTSIFYRKLN